MGFKYTRPDQSRFSNQGVFRNVPSENLALGSGRESENMEDWVPGYNYFCMVADPLYAFNFNWGDFAYPWSTGEFEPRPNAVITNFNCDANVQPYASRCLTGRRVSTCAAVAALPTAMWRRRL